MKKLITILVMLIGMMATGQVDKKANFNQSWSNRDKLKYKFITVGFDTRNAVVGSNPTGDKPELDYQIKIGAVDKNVEIGMFYENFHAIEFQAYGATVGYIFMIAENTDIYTGIEAGSIIRWDDDNFFMGGGNAELRQHLGDWIVGGQVNYRYRGEWGKMVGSFMVNLTRKF